MSNRSRLFLVALLSLLVIRSGAAQGPSSRQSHHEVPGEFDASNGQEMMAQRLRELHELHELQDNVQGMLKDPEFLNRIKEKFTPEQLERLQQKLRKGEGLGQDPSWQRLLDHAREGRKLDDKQIEKLRQWAERTEPKPMPTPTEHRPTEGHTQPPQPPPIMSGPKPPPEAAAAPPSPPEPSFFDHVQEETTKWVTNNLDDVGGDLLEALAEMDGNREDSFLAEMIRNVRQPDLSIGGDFLPGTGLPDFMPKVGEYFRDKNGFWEETSSLFHQVPSPTLPNFGDTALSLQPGSSPASGGGWASVFLTFLLIGLTVFLAWKLSLGRKSSEGRESERWRLGSWPVAPGNVATRRDVVRAFEYLALLCLGVDASTRHHHELAQRLAGQDQDNPARRQAAQTLAWLYEQARYAPPSETLSPGELTDARHALCLLAGVAAA